MSGPNGERSRVEREGSGHIRVLLIPPMLERNSDTFFRTLSQDIKGKFTFFSVKPIPRRENGTVDYHLLLERCREVICQEAISVLYSNKQAGNLVQAVLTAQFSHLRGPSIESVFLCNHKYYTTTVVDSRQKRLPYYVLDVGKDKYDTAHDVLDGMHTPCIVRACLGSGHSVFCFHNRDQLLKVLEKCRTDIAHIVDMQRYLLEKFVDTRKYPLALENVVLLNPFLDRFQTLPNSSWVSVSIEACVFKGEIIPWSICDAITLPYGSREATHFFSGFEMPTKITDRQSELLWAEFTKDIYKLCKQGFNNSFVYAEYMVFEDGAMHLVSINGSPHAKCTHMYEQGLVDGNNIEAALLLATGVRPKAPKPKGLYVLTYSMFVFESGKADNLIKFQAAMSHENVALRYLPGQDIMIEPAKDYALVGFITVNGSSFKECVEQVKSIREEILKTPQLVPLTC